MFATRWTRSAWMFAFIAVAFGAPVAHAWPGFDWDTWQEITGVTAPDIDSPQAGNAELTPLVMPSDGAAQWESRRAAIEAALTALLGAPTDIQRDPEPARFGERIEEDGYTRTHLWIPAEEGDPIPAYLLEPAEPIATPAPVMIVLHQTQAGGKDEASGLSGNPEMAFAVELVKRGYVCIAPDAIGFGERTPADAEPYHGAHDFYRRHPRWSFFGKMNWDIARIIDFLEERPGIDPDRIGVIGHSHGAYGTLMAMAFEPRLAAGIASCGFTTLRSDPNPERWSHLTALMPRLGFYLDDIAMAPFDWHEVLAMSAPRPFFNWATLDDTIFPETDNLDGVHEQVRQVYGLLGAIGRFEGRLEPGPHAFPPDARPEAYDWLDQQFAH